MNNIGKVIVFVYLIVGSQGQWLDEHCGSGGSTSRPWLAAIYIWDPQKWETYFHCTGTLITDRFILTHAIPNTRIGYIFARLGATYDDAPTSQWYTTESLTMHPNFKIYGKHTKNDISLIKLDRKAEFNALIRPICLFHSKSQNQKQLQRQIADSTLEFTFSGWTKPFFTSNSKVLKSTRVVRLNPQLCSNTIEDPLEQNQICGETDSDELCFRNSGGPLEIVINKWGKNELLRLDC
ncbi:CLIP domain-containing serine protease 2-like [Drosophila elegans]|uniref:CLIP domain-containing serine protease 2-like n=1 Tax=Drosophila elegans TaxID=30023 RepID=UPI0007E73EE6|nr:CLIP domain-containing serine protease 2-like [Drosophila elegans]